MPGSPVPLRRGSPRRRLLGEPPAPSYGPGDDASRARKNDAHASGFARARQHRAGTNLTSARIDGPTVTLSLSMSVQYPISVRQVASRVRERVTQRVHELCALEVVEVDITVPKLLTRRAAPPRVV